MMPGVFDPTDWGEILIEAQLQQAMQTQQQALQRLAAAYREATVTLRNDTSATLVRRFEQNPPLSTIQADRWHQDWGAEIGAAARRQQSLTQSYIRYQGVVLQSDVKVSPTLSDDAYREMLNDLQETRKHLDRLERRKGELKTLRKQAQELADKAKARAASFEDAAIADAARAAHTPVIKLRTEAANRPLAEAVAITAPTAGINASNILREAEKAIVDATDWPRFKNGKHMLYKRVTSPGACGWCRLVASRLYSLDSYKKGSQWHKHCACTFVAVTLDEVNQYARVFKASGDTQDYYAAAASVGLWSGPAKGTFHWREIEAQRFDPATAAAAGRISIKTVRGVTYMFDRDLGKYQPL